MVKLLLLRPYNHDHSQPSTYFPIKLLLPDLIITSTRFQCSYCDSNYAPKNDLDTHIKQKHEENGNLETNPYFNQIVTILGKLLCKSMK